MRQAKHLLTRRTENKEKGKAYALRKLVRFYDPRILGFVVRIPFGDDLTYPFSLHLITHIQLT